jgi:dihydrofolate reductase
MRKVVLYELLSLDGVAEDPDKFVTDWDEAMDANLAAVIASQDAVILGRRSYDEWSEFWPGSEIEPFAEFINGVAKYVASSTPLGRQWHNAAAIEGGLVQFVQNLKNSSGGDIGVHASISVAQALLAADAIDEVRLVVAPSIAGRGRRLLDGLPPIRLESLRSATSPRGYLLAEADPLGGEIGQELDDTVIGGALVVAGGLVSSAQVPTIIWPLMVRSIISLDG